MNAPGTLTYKKFLLAGTILALAGALLAQVPEKILMVNGVAQGSLVQLNGHSYIDVETLAQITNGSVTIEPTRVLLTLPDAAPAAAPAAPAAAAPAAAPPPPPPGLSRDFSRIAIAELAEMREWRGAVGTILTYGVPVVGTWPQDYHDRADADLRQVEVAATSNADQDALQLLKNNFANLAAWANGVVATRQSLNATQTVNPSITQNDPVLAKINDCSRFLNSMLVSGQFADNASCH